MQYSTEESSVINDTDIYIFKFNHRKDTVRFSADKNLLLNVC